MSIKSIDSQIMIARTTEFSKDTSTVQKRPEIAQEYLAAREKINDAQDQSRVAKTFESKLSELRPDEDGGGNGGGGGESGPGSGKNKKDGETDPDMLVPPVKSVIDIRV